ncbi:MAG: aminopeptidase P family protein [Gammaproteobacteria bacterium]|nr:aminopeptidase P family protein [Gammaproteobacteria bacterium]
MSSLPDVLRIENGEKIPGLFTDEEMYARVRRLRDAMQSQDVDYVLFTSYHNIDYYSGFLYCAFGRSYGLVVGYDTHTTVSANVDYGQPWRRSYGDNIVYTDWRRDNFFKAVRELIPDGGTVGVEHDHLTLQNMEKLRQALPGARFVDISEPVMRMRMVKTGEEISHIAEMARIADAGGAACVEAVSVGTPEYEVALHTTSTMVREIARRFPDAELRDTWTWFQSGINTDGAHNPVTTRRILSGDILSMNCFPMVGGYYVALERTLFAESASDEHLRLWEINCKVHDEGKRLIRPGATCSGIARALNEIYEAHDLLEYRTFGYGHSFGVLCHYYGREAGLELREDVDTVLEPGMVVSMEPMITIPEGLPGAGGYREHDVLVVTEDGNRILTAFPYGPAHNIIGRT